MSDSLPKEKLVLRGTRSRRFIEPFHVMSFDPGGTTGVSGLFFVGGWSDEITLEDFTLVSHEFPNTPTGHHMNLMSLLIEIHQSIPAPFTVVTESFNYRQYATDRKQGEKGNGAATVDLISVEYIGVMKLFCQIEDVPYFEYSPGDCKPFVTDAKLKAMGGDWFLEPATPMRHINDSRRPLVNYLVRELNLHSPIVDSWRG